MASALSEEEFHRMQLQLLELRTVNYQLDDKCKRQERDLFAIQTRFETTDKELQKANKTIYKSKKAKEVELLIQENETLQNKLHSQEEEFRLQNETIMQELGQVIKSNESFEKEVASLRGSGQPSGSSAHTQSLNDEVRRLQAQNSALQKNLISSQEKNKEEIGSLRHTIADLEAQCFKLSGQRGTPVGAGSSESRTVEGQSDPECLREPDAEDTHQDDSPDQTDSSRLEPATKLDQEPTKPATTTSSSDKVSLQATVEQQSRKLIDLELNLDTEKEEKRILKEQMATSENQYKEQVKSLQEEVDKITEKFKKKQESLVQLQEEKELIYTELSNRIEEVESTKNTEINSLKSQSNRLQEDLSECNQVLEDYEQKSNVRIYELENLVQSLEGRVSDASLETSYQLEEQNSVYLQQMHSLKQQITDLKRVNHDLEAQIKEGQVSHQRAVEELHATQRDRDQQIHALQEANRVAEKRKSLLDELAIKYQEESDQHREHMKSLEESHRAEVDLLSDQLDELKVRSQELEEVQEEIEIVKSQVHSLDNTKGWLERRLNETEENLNHTKLEHDESMSKQETNHKVELQALEEKHNQEVKNFEEQMHNIIQEKETKEEDILKLKQEIKDSLGDKKIHEKKGATIIKDLKRQLHQERKRAEKLQERLQDLLTDSRSRQSVEELFRPVDPNDRYKGDASSVSSWNASILSRDNTYIQSPEEEAPSVSLVHENADLLKRLGELQQEKWMMEEKVSHLESSNSCMAEDLLQKTAVIEHYVMDSHIESAAQSPSSDKISLKRMVDIIKDRGDENLRDMNKKLQNMLEETLTKNMHLQKDLETLSQEVVRLSKQAVIAAPPGGQSAN